MTKIQSTDTDQLYDQTYPFIDGSLIEATICLKEPADFIAIFMRDFALENEPDHCDAPTHAVPGAVVHLKFQAAQTGFSVCCKARVLMRSHRTGEGCGKDGITRITFDQITDVEDHGLLAMILTDAAAKVARGAGEA